jgi:DNA helicase-2/ATP-dependent DNA helicase PcrA
MTLDEKQQAIVELYGKKAMVLAAPGCGKTRILADRIIYAAAVHNVGFDKMLCLTFTNRASREMADRISLRMGRIPEGLFVGNLHRFCIRFLYANDIISPDTSIIEEEDRDLFLSQQLGLSNLRWRNEVLSTASELYMQEHQFPIEVHRQFHFKINQTHIQAARRYEQFKSENNLIDFDDCLLYTYNAMLNQDIDNLKLASFDWVQVDEVQDLTPLQLAIIDQLTLDPMSTVLYLGDEQQAIFEFLGAGGRALDIVKSRCNQNIYNLSRNYRSPGYLVDLCNTFALFQLGIDPLLLPQANNDNNEASDQLILAHANKEDHEYAIVAQARKLLRDYPKETVAILAHTNREAESMSEQLRNSGLKHLLISRKDTFKQVAFNTVFAHMALAISDCQPMMWSRILYRINCVKQAAKANELMYILQNHAMTPADLMSDDGLTRVRRAANALDNETIVVFDTETTGLNVFEDDIIQIAAVKVKGGKIVKGSEFSVLIKTDKPIPTTLKDGLVNPMVEVYRNGVPIERSSALRQFVKYVGNCRLCGHNVDFDISILRSNLKRDGIDEPKALSFIAIDTLSISKLIFPFHRTYNLATLLDLFKIKAKNTHLATDDVNATAQLLLYIAPFIYEKSEKQIKILSNATVNYVAERLRLKYKPLYDHTQRMLHNPEKSAENNLIAEFNYIYLTLFSQHFINAIDNWDLILKLFETVLTNPLTECRLREQIYEHLRELHTFNEGDLYANGLIEDRLTVMTIHKAKGLEMDNVIVYNAQTPWNVQDSYARVYYVAFSRAKKRLIVYYTGNLDESIVSVKHKFKPMSSLEVKAQAMIEKFRTPDK